MGIFPQVHFLFYNRSSHRVRVCLCVCPPLVWGCVVGYVAAKAIPVPDPIASGKARASLSPLFPQRCSHPQYLGTFW